MITLKKIIIFIVVFCLCGIGVYAQPELYAERKNQDADICNVPIDTFYIDKTAYVSVDDLKYYGYNSSFDPETNIINLSRDKFSLPFYSYEMYEKMFSQRKKEKIIPSEIKVFVNGKQLESFCISNTMLVKLSDVDYSYEDEMIEELENAPNKVSLRFENEVPRDYTSHLNYDYYGQVNEAHIPHGIGKLSLEKTSSSGTKEYIGFFDNGKPTGKFISIYEGSTFRNYGSVTDIYIYGELSKAQGNFTSNILDLSLLMIDSNGFWTPYKLTDEIQFNGIIYDRFIESIVTTVPKIYTITSVQNNFLNKLLYTEGMKFSHSQKAENDYSQFTQYNDGGFVNYTDSVITESEDESDSLILNGAEQGGGVNEASDLYAVRKALFSPVETADNTTEYVYTQAKDCELSGVPIDTYYIEDIPYVSVDDLKFYGYTYIYNPYTCNFELFREKYAVPTEFNEELWNKMFSERTSEKIIQSPIKVFVNGKSVQSYCTEKTVLVKFDDIEYSLKSELNELLSNTTDKVTSGSYTGQFNEQGLPHGIGYADLRIKYKTTELGGEYIGHFENGKPSGPFYCRLGISSYGNIEFFGKLVDGKTQITEPFPVLARYPDESGNNDKYQEYPYSEEKTFVGVYNTYSYPNKVKIYPTTYDILVKNENTQFRFSYTTDKLYDSLKENVKNGVTDYSSFTAFEKYVPIFYNEAILNAEYDNNGEIILNSYAAGGGVNIRINPIILLNNNQLSKKGVIINGRTLVPLRELFEKMGAVVEWIEESSSVVITKDDTVIKLQINNSIITVNEVTSELDVAPQLINDSTYIPARAVSEALGAEVQWNEALKQVVITSAH